MSIEARRWVMTAVKAPLECVAFTAAPGPGEVVVAIAGCGVCHTDLGYYYDDVRTNIRCRLRSGTRSAAASSRRVRARRLAEQAVIVPAVLPCGECDLCRRGLAPICRAQKMLGNDIQGGFASHIVVPARGLCAVDETRLARAGLTLADVSIVADALTTPYQAVRRAGVAPGHARDRRWRGRCRRVLRTDRDTRSARRSSRSTSTPTSSPRSRPRRRADARCARARQRRLKAAIGAFAKAHGLQSTEWSIFECSGTAAGQLTAYGLLVHGATLSVVGFTMDKVEVRLSNLMAFDAKAIGNWGCPPEHYPAALDLVLDGKVAIKPFVEARPLDTINEVFAAVHHKDIKKRVVLTPAP